MYGLISEQEFEINNTAQYRLSVQVSLNGFSFSVIDPAKNKLLAIQRSPAVISSENFLGRRFMEWLGKHELLKSCYAETRLLFYTDKFTLVPGEIYIKERQDDIFHLVFGNQSGNLITENLMENISGHLLFSVPTGLKEAFNSTFSDYLLIHPLVVLNQKIQNKVQKGGRILVLYFEKNSFSLLLYIDNNLQLTNSYKFFHTNDVIYYVLSVIKQQGISLKDVKLFLAGDINYDYETYKNLKKYFSETDFFIPDIDYDSQVFQESLHGFVTLC